MDERREMKRTAEGRFALAAEELRERRGGRPEVFATDDGRIGFRYPDGTVTVGGELEAIGAPWDGAR